MKLASNPDRFYAKTIPSRNQVLSEISRELAIRRGYYAKLVAAGKLKQEESDKRIDAMQCAYDFIMENWPNSPELPDK